jgi:hypothetical protein
VVSQLERRQDQLLRRFEQFFRERDQLICRQPAVAFVHRLGQGARTRVEGAVDVAANHHQHNDQGAEQKQLGRQVERDEIGDCAYNRSRRADEDEKRPRR